MMLQKVEPVAPSQVQPTTIFLALYPLCVGVLLSAMQVGLFFQLTFTLSSTYSTFLMVTLCWLIGSALGTTFPANGVLATRLFLLIALLAYAVCSLVLMIAPFNTQLTPLYALLIVVTGLYPGVFFASLSSRYSARTLFSRENNGFIIGYIVATILFMVMGRMVLWAMPFVMAGVVLVMESRSNQ